MLRCRAVPRDDDEVRAQPGEDGDPARAADAALVVAARGGDQQAFGRLFDRWFDPVHDIAWRIVRDRDVAAEVAQDVFLVAWQGLGDLEQPGSFGGWVRRIARNRALNRLDRERRSRPDGEAAAAALDRGAPDVDMTAALGEREQNELVWAAAAALGERDASLLDLHLRHGMGAPEIAAELGVTPNNAHQLLHRLKGKLGGAIRAWVLWRGGGTPCAGLDRAVADAGVTTFGAEAVRVVDRHAKGCATCEERRTLRLAPEALFAAIPIGVTPPLLKAEAAVGAGAGRRVDGGVERGRRRRGGGAADAGSGAAGDGVERCRVARPAPVPDAGGAESSPRRWARRATSPTPGTPPGHRRRPTCRRAPDDRGSGTDRPHGGSAPRGPRGRRLLVVLVLLAAVGLVLHPDDDPDEVATSEAEAPPRPISDRDDTAPPSTVRGRHVPPPDPAPRSSTTRRSRPPPPRRRRRPCPPRRRPSCRPR